MITLRLGFPECPLFQASELNFTKASGFLAFVDSYIRFFCGH
jgi:hypothetical protein